MTSYTKALYKRDPKAADDFHNNQKFEHRIVYGRTPTLEQFVYRDGKPSLMFIRKPKQED